MADRKVEDYAYNNACSNKEAKRRMRTRRKGKVDEDGFEHVVRGLPVAGTGVPKGE